MRVSCVSELRPTGLTNLWHTKDAHIRCGRGDGVREGLQNLLQSNQAQTLRTLPRRGQFFEHPVRWNQQVRPAVPGPQDIPGAQDGRSETAGADCRLALRAHLDIRLHHWRRLRDADIYKM